MTREDLVRRLEAAEKQMIGLQDEIQNLKAKLDEMQDEPEIPKYPFFKYGEKSTWVRCFEPSHESTCGNPDGFISDYYLFHTKDYAQEYADKCKLIAMLLHCKWCVEKELFKFDSGPVGDYPPAYTVVYNRPMDEYSVVTAHVFEGSQVYFKSKDAAQKAADWLNENWSGCDD